MFPQARTGTDADAILGVVPRWVYAPRTLEDARAFVEATGREGLSLGFIGGGTDLALGAPPRKLDAVLATGGLSRTVEYAPADMIITVEAGTPLAALNAAVASHGQRLTLDPPAPERATVGGIIASNAFGPRRARFGSVRDLLIGVSIVRADGALARGGGKVVKNVAGFDIPKLMCGSLGTLGLIVTATFRLHPAPEVERTILVPARSASQVRALVSRLRSKQLEPTSVVALSNASAQFEVALRFEGFGAGVTQQLQRFAELQRVAGETCELLDERDAQSWWRRHDEARSLSVVRAKIAALPSAIEAVVAKLRPVLDSLRAASFVWYATLGLGFIGGSPSEPAIAARALDDLRSVLREMGGSLVLHAAPSTIRSTVDEWGSAPPAVSVMRRLKERFDPEHRLNPGRFAGAI